jgi:hypothetical protein
MHSPYIMPPPGIEGCCEPLCRLRGEDLIIIDRDQAPHEQLEIVAEALQGRDLEAVYLSPAARRILQAGAP